MTIVIGHVTPNDTAKYNLVKFIQVTKICSLNKDLEYDIYLLNSSINEFGQISDTEIILDEIFIALKINKFYYNINDDAYLKNASSYYGVTVYSLNE